MLPGFNHNIRYRDRVFHVQTEDNGLSQPHLVTQVFVDGHVLALEKSPYHDILAEAPNEAARNAKIRVKMQDQHKRLLKNLVQGAYDDRIQSYLGGPAPTDDDATIPAPPALPMPEGKAADGALGAVIFRAEDPATPLLDRQLLVELGAPAPSSKPKDPARPRTDDLLISTRPASPAKQASTSGFLSALDDEMRKHGTGDLSPPIRPAVKSPSPHDTVVDFSLPASLREKIAAEVDRVRPAAKHPPIPAAPAPAPIRGRMPAAEGATVLDPLPNISRAIAKARSETPPPIPRRAPLATPLPVAGSPVAQARASAASRRGPLPKRSGSERFQDIDRELERAASKLPPAPAPEDATMLELDSGQLRAQIEAQRARLKGTAEPPASAKGAPSEPEAPTASLRDRKREDRRNIVVTERSLDEVILSYLDDQD